MCNGCNIYKYIYTYIYIFRSGNSVQAEQNVFSTKENKKKIIKTKVKPVPYGHGIAKYSPKISAKAFKVKQEQL